MTELIGCALIFSGILIAIQFNRTIPDDDLENIQGNKYTGSICRYWPSALPINWDHINETCSTNNRPYYCFLSQSYNCGSNYVWKFRGFIKNNQSLGKNEEYKKTLFSIFLGFMGMGVGMTMLIICSQIW